MMRLFLCVTDAHGENMWYSFNYGPVHFIQFDTEVCFVDSVHQNVGRM
jgi:hypothetical protein